MIVSTVVAMTDVQTGPAAALPIPPPPVPVRTSDPLGTHPVGVQVSSYTSGGRRLRLTTWYPAVADPAPPYVTPGGITGTAVQNGAADRAGGPYPLIMFSPGLGAPGDGYYFYAQNLASHGYVVVGIDHDDAEDVVPGPRLPDLPTGLRAIAEQNSSDSVFSLFSDWFRRTQFAMTYRPQQIRVALDEALRRNDDPAEALSGMIDPDRIGMSGHSLGAAYTLLGGGMTIPCDHPISGEAADWQNSPIVRVDPCAMPAAQAMTDPAALRDPRIKAIVPLASPVFVADPYIREAAANISIPMMFLTGADPYLEASRSPQWQVYDAAQGPKYFVEIADTDHFLVTDVAALNPYFSSVQLPWDKADFAGKSAVYMRYSAAFFDRYLKGDDTAEDVLRAPATGVVAAVHYQN
ncbi:alpha/beta hydrolase family protein [Nocardia sp. NPDC058379]|uniref:alpha/beta hydrolase family protein n=1 Tax=unclassified Nocardia TaxID=2637762 RepID=UPI003655B56E